MKKTATFVAIAGFTMASNVDDIHDNNFFLNSIKNGYYTATNWALSHPVAMTKGVEYGLKFGPSVYHGTKGFLGFEDQAGDNQMDIVDDEFVDLENADDEFITLDEIHDNNLFLNKIKNGYYTATNWALSHPVAMTKGVEYGLKFGPSVYHGTKGFLGFEDQAGDNEMNFVDEAVDDLLVQLGELIGEGLDD